MKNNGGLYDTIDLGLLTRVICHECNNLIASQQGFLQLLQRNPDNDTLKTQWLSELTRVNQGLKLLVSGLHAQGLHYSADASPEHQSQARTSAEEASALGVAIPVIALQRLLANLLSLEPVQLVSVQRAEHASCSTLWASTVQSAPHVQIQLAAPVSTISAASWIEASATILPDGSETAHDWKKALILGLLRQSGGDMAVSPKQLLIFIPIEGVTPSEHPARIRNVSEK